MKIRSLINNFLAYPHPGQADTADAREEWMGSLRDVISSKTGNAPGSVDDDHDVNDVLSVAHAEPHLQQDVAGALLQALTTHPLEVSQHRLEEILTESSTATVTASDSNSSGGAGVELAVGGIVQDGAGETQALPPQDAALDANAGTDSTATQPDPGFQGYVMLSPDEEQGLVSAHH